MIKRLKCPFHNSILKEHLSGHAADVFGILENNTYTSLMCEECNFIFAHQYHSYTDYIYKGFTIISNEVSDYRPVLHATEAVRSQRGYINIEYDTCETHIATFYDRDKNAGYYSCGKYLNDLEPLALVDILDFCQNFDRQLNMVSFW